MIENSDQLAPQMNTCPWVSVSFRLTGRHLAADHGYLLYSAIAKATQGDAGATVTVNGAAGRTSPSPALSALHKVDWLAIELVSGFPAGRGLITLPTSGATLNLRIPAEHYRHVLQLSGKRLEIGGHQIRLGLPVARALEPARSLYARVVTIKKFTESEPFIEAVKRKLHSFGVKARVELPLSEPPAVAGGRSDVEHPFASTLTTLDPERENSDDAERR